MKSWIVVAIFVLSCVSALAWRTGDSNLLASLPGIQLLLRASVGIPSGPGANIPQWNDQSGNGKNAVQQTSTATLIGNADGLPAVNCSSSQFLVGTNGDFAAQTFTAFAVYLRNPSIGNANMALASKGDGISNTLSTWELLAQVGATSTVRSDTFVGNSNNNSGTSYLGSSDWELVEIERIDSAHKNIYLNGVLQGSGSDSGGSLNAGAAQLGVCDAGFSSSSGGLNFTGYLRLLAYYSPVLSATNRQAAEGYIKSNLAIHDTSPFNFLTCGIVGNNGIASIYQTGSATVNGWNFSQPAGVTNPVYTIPAGGGTGTTSFTAGCNLFWSASQQRAYMAYEMNDYSGTQKTFGISYVSCPSNPNTSPSCLGGTWTWLTDVQVIPVGTTCTNNCFVWNPHWFIDDDNSVHIYGYYGTTATTGSNTPFIVDATNSTFTTWSAASDLSGSGIPLHATGDNYLIPPSKSPLGQYSFWYDNGTAGANTGYPELAVSSTLKGSYTSYKTGNWVGIGNQWQGFTPIAIGSAQPGPNGAQAWRFYFYGGTIGVTGWYYVDSFDGWKTWQNIQKATNLSAADIITTGPLQVGP